ncbi:MAG: sulfatase [Phycisphaerae bacterium]|nr:sulfatase [Phycisphaerae bacterium]
MRYCHPTPWIAGPVLLLGAAPVFAAPETERNPRRPNIIVIVADDLGYADIGVYGCKDVPTPQIDSIARNGVRFSNGYVSCPVCSPTRAGLVTGRYQQRFGHEFNPGQLGQAAARARATQPNTPAVTFGLPLDEVTLADRLKSAGYATGMVGKWHLGDKPPYRPLKRGFEEYYGFLGGAHPYVDLKASDRAPIFRGNEPLDESEYLTDAFAREAVAYIDRHKKQPFFLYLTFNAVHTPQQVPDKYLARFGEIQDPKRRNMAAMLSAMDDGIGRVLGKIRSESLENDTLIFFISDNGGPTKGNGSLNTPFTGFKGGLNEGGIRVPFLVQWKGQIPPGRVYDRAVISLDIHPTALAAASPEKPLDIPADKALDGVNLLPFLRAEKSGSPHEVLFWRFGRQAAVRKDDVKLLRIQGQTTLYDLSKDPAEEHDLSGEKPELIKELTAALAKWESELKKPLWPQTRARAAAARDGAGNRQRQGRRATPTP